jgi:hypothetical protein
MDFLGRTPVAEIAIVLKEAMLVPAFAVSKVAPLEGLLQLHLQRDAVTGLLCAGDSCIDSYARH